MDQPDLLSIIAQTREEAIARVDEHADPDWKSTAYNVGRALAATRPTFTSQDIFDAMPDTVHTHEPRAMGAVIRALKRDGVLEATDQFVSSTSVLAHGRPARVWRSLLIR